MKVLKFFICSLLLLSLASCATSSLTSSSDSAHSYKSDMAKRHMYHAHKQKIDF